MKFFNLIQIITNERPKFGDIIEPYKILDIFNSSEAGPLIDYTNYNLNKDRETAKKWFNTLFNRYFDLNIIYNWELEIKSTPTEASTVVVKKMIKLFNYYEEVYNKYLPLINLYKNQLDFFNDQMVTTSTHETKNNVMPQIDTESDNFPENIVNTKSTTTMENKTNLIDKINNVNNKYDDIINKMVDEFSDYFSLDFDFDY